MAITNTILLKGLLGAVVCLGSASAAIANRGKIVSYFSKNKGKDKKAESDKKTAGGVAVNGTPTTGTTEGDQTQENKASGAGKTANGGQGSKAPSQATPGGAGANPGQAGQAQTTPSTPGAGASTGDQGAKGSGGGAGQPGTSQNTQTNQVSQSTSPTISDSEIKTINEKISSKLKLPEDCKLGTTGNNNTKECNLTEEQLKKVNFVNKDGTNDLTIEGVSGNLKLVVKSLSKKNEEDTKKYGSNFNENDLIFTFKDQANEIKIKKNSSDTNPIVIKKGTDTEFSVYTEKITKEWYPSSLGFKVGLGCGYDATTKCKPRGGDNAIKLLDSTNSSIKEIKIEDSDKSKEITVLKDQENYNQGFKFTVPTGGIKGKENAGDLAEGDYEIKYIDKKGWALAKKSSAQAT